MKFVIIGISQIDTLRGMTVDTFGLFATKSAAEIEIDDLIPENMNTLFFVKPVNTRGHT